MEAAGGGKRREWKEVGNGGGEGWRRGGGKGGGWKEVEDGKGAGDGRFFLPPAACGGGGASAKRSRGVEREAARLFQQGAVAVKRFAAVFRKQIQQILHTHLGAGVAADIQHRPTLMKHYRSLAAT